MKGEQCAHSVRKSTELVSPVRESSACSQPGKSALLAGAFSFLEAVGSLVPHGF